MKKIILFTAATLSLSFFFAFKKPGGGSNPIQADLNNLLNDLKNAGYSVQNTGTTVANSLGAISGQRGALQSRLGGTPNDSSHFGVISIGDIIKMLAENPNNNSILVYPVTATSDNMGIVCVGAVYQGALSPSAKALSIYPNSSFIQSSWCPNMCPSN